MLPELETAPCCQPWAALSSDSPAFCLPSGPGALLALRGCSCPLGAHAWPAGSPTCKKVRSCLPFYSLHRIGAPLTLLEKLGVRIGQRWIGTKKATGPCPELLLFIQWPPGTLFWWVGSREKIVSRKQFMDPSNIVFYPN